MDKIDLARKIQYKKTSNQTIRLVFVFTVFIVVSNAFAYVYWGELFKGYNSMFFALIFIIAMLKAPISKENFKRIVYLLIFCPFLSAPVSYMMYGQPLKDSIMGLTPNLIWASYFIFNRYHFAERTLIKALLIISFIILFLQISQQFTYPTAYFGVFSEKHMLYSGSMENVEIRNGIYRFRVHFNGYTIMPILLFYLGLLKQKITLNRMLIILSMIIAIYLSLTRQLMVSCVFVVILSLFLNKNGGIKIQYLLFIMIISICIYYNLDSLLGNLTEMTSDNLNKDYIRLIEYAFYWDKVCENVWAFLFGHGIAISGIFLKQFSYWENVMRLFTGDIGVIGIWFHYGMIYILLYLYMLWIVYKYRKLIPQYILLFVVFTGFISVMIFPFWIYASPNFIWTVMFYLCDLHINKSPLRMYFVKQ